MLPSVTFLDLETTGTSPLKDRITEIALVRFDHGVETARWQTLVNPGMPIPAFIQSLTGIDDAMVQHAPSFADVAGQLLAFLEGTVLAAHNVRFDHGFLKAELKRMGITLQQKVLCTVKLSRLLYPQHFSHGIDAIVARHHIEGLARHRAMGDVEAVLIMLADARRELGEEAVQAAAEKLMSVPTLPGHVDASLVGELPEAPGVYWFCGENDQRLYIGKAINVRARVFSHFGREASAQEKRMAQEIKRFEWIPVAGELSAVLLESRLLKTHQPVYQRQKRYAQPLYSWQIDSQAQPNVRLLDLDEIDSARTEHLFGTFKSKRQATEALRKIAELNQLCLKELGLEPGRPGACQAYPLRRCKGVCYGQESTAMHTLRLQQAMMAHKLRPWPYAGKIGIEEYNLDNDLRQIHVFEYWTYLGTADSDESMQVLLAQAATHKFALETYKLLLKILSQKKTRVLNLAEVRF